MMHRPVSRMMRWATYRLLSVMVVLMSACEQGLDPDWLEYVQQTKNGQTGRLEEIPTPKALVTFSYRADSDKIRDPFEMALPGIHRQPGGKASGLMPVSDRRRGPLEGYPLDTLQMMGTLTRTGNVVALVKGGDGVIYKIKKGHYMGQNHGKVIDIRPDEIILREMISDGVGGWLIRPASLVMSR